VLNQIQDTITGDVEAVKADLIAALQDSPIAQRQDVETYVTNMLTKTASGAAPTAPDNPPDSNN
jgi:hypothetical protein